MTLADFIIVYFAIGAPIGVYALYRNRYNSRQKLSASLASNVILWPLFISLLAAPYVQAVWEKRSIGIVEDRLPNDHGTGQTRNEFIASVEHAGSREFRRDAINEFDRFAALSSQIDNASGASNAPVPLILQQSSHPNPKLAARSLYRNNLSRLKAHRSQSLEQLKAIQTQLSARHRNSPKVTLAFSTSERQERSI